MIISDKKKFIFIHIYKTGGTSIRRCLEKYDSSYNFFHFIKSKFTENSVLRPTLTHKHSDAKTIRKTIGAEIYDNYFSFCFVRNPWEWQVSLYNFILRSKRNHHHNKIGRASCRERV